MEKIKILLAEDDVNLGSLLEQYLHAKDFSVDLYPDGLKAFNGFNSKKYDICILDVMMPKKDGFTLAGEIREINSKIPIIFLTAKTLKEDVLADAEPREIPLLPAGEGELKLMAIAWSDEPTNRMAVINGGIIREGGSIGGAHIEKINEDDVIVRKGNRVYRLVFKLK